MAPFPVWSGNLRLSLVLVPVRMFPAISTEGTIAFRMIHAPSGKPIKYLKGIETEDGFEEVPEEEIIKGYEHTKGHYVLIEPSELDALGGELISGDGSGGSALTNCNLQPGKNHSSLVKS